MSPPHAHSLAPSQAQWDAATQPDRESWKPEAGGFEHPVLQELHPHALWETTWLETEDQSQATHTQPQRAGTCSGAAIISDSQSMPAAHPQRTRSSCGPEPVSWALQRCTGAMAQFWSLPAVMEVTTLVSELGNPKQHFWACSWLRGHMSHGTWVLSYHQTLSPALWRKDKLGEGISVCTSPTSTALVLLSKMAKLGSAQTPAAQQPPNIHRTPTPSP